MASTVQIHSQLEPSHPRDRLGTVILSSASLLPPRPSCHLKRLPEFAPGTQADGESLLVSMHPVDTQNLGGRDQSLSCSSYWQNLRSDDMSLAKTSPS